MKRIFAVLVLMAAIVLGAGWVFASQPPAAQSEYVPAAPGTATEQLPAGPLVISAYAFVWVATTAYVWTVWRRLNKVEADMRALEQRRTTRTER